MIIEGLLCTQRSDGSPHVAPMGPVVDQDLTEWTLRPFQTSTTFQLLREKSTCVFHVVDDVLPVVRAALGYPLELTFRPLSEGDWFIQSACHWYRLQVTEWNISQPRAEARAEVIDHDVLRPFWGWNRAKHAVLEATIMATRLHLADRGQIEDDLKRCQSAVEKTAGPRELHAWQLVMEYIERHSKA